jgi:hypothetical protein
MRNLSPKWDFYLGMLIFAITVAFLLLGVVFLVKGQETAESSYQAPNMTSLTMVEGNTLVAITPYTYYDYMVLGNLTELADIIIMCESGGRPDVCNKQYGCRAGIGLFQLIPSTVRYCEEKLAKTIDPFNPNDNYECGMWLLENEGTRHWGYEGADWGSFHCWSKAL